VIAIRPRFQHCQKAKIVILRASDKVRCLDSGGVCRRCPKDLNADGQPLKGLTTHFAFRDLAPNR